MFRHFGYLILTLLCILFECRGNLIRGLDPLLSPFYDVSLGSFNCLDESRKNIPYSQLNDDYCDCPDGSDEPGTSACSKSLFYCFNRGYTPSRIPSSQVNDGLCDCCDGSDEWSSLVPCYDNCLELGKESLRRREERENLTKQGLLVKEQMIQEASVLLATKVEALKKLESQRESAEKTKLNYEEIKSEIESKESLALEKFKKAEEDMRLKEEEISQKLQTEEKRRSFSIFDTNGDEILSLDEIRNFSDFDFDENGIVSEEEVVEFLSGNDSMNWSQFDEFGWKMMMSQHRRNKPQSEDSSSFDSNEDLLEMSSGVHEETLIEEESQDEDDESQDEGHEKDQEDDFDKDQEEDHEKTQDSFSSNETEKYDEETRALISEANDARSAFSDAERSLNDLDREIQALKTILNHSYGPSNEFLSLLSSCFEYTDHEYTYKFCPFDYVSQRSKGSSGGETKLGTWNSWKSEFSVMAFTQGAVCWNGPPRSTNVYLECGLQNSLVGSSEPNKCEYEFVFKTPAACTPILSSSDEHDEL